jgi:hypothetical protein
MPGGRLITLVTLGQGCASMAGSGPASRLGAPRDGTHDNADQDEGSFRSVAVALGSGRCCGCGEVGVPGRWSR